ncbi:MAG: HAD-IA family hydrolase [Alphaproteobacteria bacterium]|nr:HAD-IA family hydrolase [Alphaproteobacteria bacterium]
MDAILFDCDGVLVDSEILAVEVETAMLAEAGLTYELHDFKARFMGMSDRAFFAALELDSRERLGRSLPDRFEILCRERLYREVEARLTEVAGTGAFLSTLAHAKAVVSSSTADKLELKLRKARLWDVFAPHVYSADHVTHAKPAPDLFLYAAAALEVAPERCLVFEDSVNGILAARAAGMRAVGFAGGAHMDETARARLLAAGAESLAASWEEARAILAEF